MVIKEKMRQIIDWRMLAGPSCGLSNLYSQTDKAQQRAENSTRGRDGGRGEEKVGEHGVRVIITTFTCTHSLVTVKSKAEDGNQSYRSHVLQFHINYKAAEL